MLHLAPQSHSFERHPPVRLKSGGVSTGVFESAVAKALTQGGDTRIQLNAQGVNGYGCAPRPDPALVQLGSSTGSVVSTAGFQAAVALYRRLHGPAGSFHAEIERQRRALSLLCGLDAVPGSELVFAASGTDIHLIAAHLVAQGSSQPLQAVMVEPCETGSGVPAALAAGLPATHDSLLPAACVPLREPNGSLRSAAAVDADFVASVARAVQAGGRCLLVLTDVSKTGLLAPSMTCAAQLKMMYGQRCSVLVDACQFRLSPSVVQSYLRHDFMVALTGSKFVGGPAFCGALLLPPAWVQRCQGLSLQALADYSATSDWPENWRAAQVLSESANLGLLLRWEAALADLRRFRALPDQVVHDFLSQWLQAVSERLALDDHFEALPVAPLQRGTGDACQNWDSVQTILPFRVFACLPDGGRRPLNVQQTALLYRQLMGAQGAPTHVARRFLVGQPVPSGVCAKVATSALRMCSGARLVTESMDAQQPVGYAIAQAMHALDEVARLAQTLR